MRSLIIIVQLQCKFVVAIIPLMFSPGINGGECKSIRSAGGASAFPLSVVGPEAPVGGEGGGIGAFPLADVREDGAEAPVSKVPPALSGLLLLLLRPLLG